MKLIMENWRRFLDEGWREEAARQEKEEKASGAAGKPLSGCPTVGEFLITLDKAQGAENAKELAVFGAKYATGLAKKAAVAAVPYVGAAVEAAADAASQLKAIKDIVGNDIKAVEWEDIQDNPVLRIFALDPGLVAALDTDILDAIDEAYERDVLRKAKPTDCLNTVESINSYVKRKIKERTDGHVVIDLPKAKT
tara:strand:- start:1054 stop:1638 length:585 start_codon:yes stop_codon:yes gene_type:complete